MRKPTSKCPATCPLLLVAACAALLVLAGGSLPAHAQDERNSERGFHPGKSYSVSDIETIGMSSGNLMLNISLGSLPPTRGGTPGFNLGLVYNSKLYGTHIDEVPNSIGVVEHRIHLNDSDEGGWRYTSPTGYHMNLISRRNEEPATGCDAGAFWYQKNAYLWKMQIIYPDGSAHTFRPYGNTDQFNDNFFSISANGWRYWASSGGSGTSCSGTFGEFLETTAPMLYYSTDGSYTRLVVDHDFNNANHTGRFNSWTLYFPDGGRVVNTAGQPQRFYDRNNNYVDSFRTTHNGHPATKISDEYGRYMIIEEVIQTDPATGRRTHDQDFVYVKGVGGVEMKWTVKWKSVEVVKQYMADIVTGGRERGNAYLTPLHMGFRVVEEIIMPAQAGGLSYRFGYNARDNTDDNVTTTYGWGELSSVTLPSGAKATYAYALDGVDGVVSQRFPVPKNVLYNKPTRKELVYRPEYDLAAPAANTPCNPQAETCTTLVWEYGPDGRFGTFDPYIDTITGPDGGVTSESFVSVESNPHSPFVNRSTSTSRPDGTMTERVWAQNRPAVLTGLSVNPYVKTEFNSIRNAAGEYARTAIKDYSFDQNGNLTQVREYDWVDYGSIERDQFGRITGTIPPHAVLKRVTATDYWCGPNAYFHSNPPRLLSAAKSVEVRDGALALSRAEFYYDDPNTTGNLTEQRAWDSVMGPLLAPRPDGSRLDATNSISARHEFDPQALGKRTRSFDARNARTDYLYDPLDTPAGPTSDLYPTEVRTAVGTAVQRVARQEYDIWTGLVTRSTDVDNNVSTVSVHDVLGRPTLVKAAVGKVDAEGRSIETHTVTEYHDAARRVVVRSDLNATGDGALVSVRHFDQQGRVRLSRRLESAAVTPEMVADETVGVKVQTRYFESRVDCAEGIVGSHQLSSNPYRAARSGEAGGESTMGWSLVKRDTHGRVMEAQTVAGAPLPAVCGQDPNSTGKVTTAYDAESVTVTDQAGKTRRTVADALGRLTKVFEAPGVAGYNYETSYTYDALANLTLVTQGEQTRAFSNSSLSRVTSATNPESGTVAYEYDANGNLKKRTDARGLHITFTYDPLNRVTLRDYSDSTPDVTFAYDTSGPHSKGRLTSVTSSVSAYTYGSYDAHGRVLSSSQVTDGQTYTMGYAYDSAGNLRSLTYPSGKAVAMEFDAAGRLSGVKNGAGGYYVGAGPTAAGRIRYAAHGGMSSQRLGNGLWEHAGYNSRLQPVEIGLGSSAADSGLLRLDFSYGGADNNGNVQSQSVTGPGGLALTQSYTYDPLNRLDIARETKAADGSQVWQQRFAYDPYGNRRFNSAETTDNVEGPPLAFSTANNRITTGGYGYDPAGNLTGDPAHSYAFDAEGRLSALDGGATPAGGASYGYDGGGRRVRRAVGAQVTVYVYDVSGRLLAEYAGRRGTGGTNYLTVDHLGSTRIVTGQGGEVRSRHDYLPFGEEVALARTQQGYGSEVVKQKFTGKERDGETGLDYFGARYFSGPQGRFTSPDPYMGSANIGNPQSWNRYTYVLNNPLRYTDPEGLDKRPEFLDYEEIYDEQRRILENSSVTVGKGKNAQTLSGQALYDYLKTNDPKALANFLNQTTALMNFQVMMRDGDGHPVFTTGISLVNSVSEIKQDRIKANVDPLLKDAVEIAGLKVTGATGKEFKGRYTGPEDSSREHGIYDLSFRDRVKEGSQQLSFASSQGFTRADIDIDYCNPYAGGALCHAAEVAWNKLTGGETNPYKVYDLLQKRPDLSIKPNYKIVEK